MYEVSEERHDKNVHHERKARVIVAWQKAYRISASSYITAVSCSQQRVGPPELRSSENQVASGATGGCGCGSWEQLLSLQGVFCCCLAAIGEVII